jgi:multidrug efflux pump
MLLSDLSIKKPVLAIAINLLFIAFGLIALERLSLREYPDIDPPIVSIETSYPGAAAQTVENQITKVIERNISGISGIRYIDAQSVDGLSTISIEFNINRDIDNAANDVRERVARVIDNMPEGADSPEVFKVDSNNRVIMWLNMSSTKLNSLQLTDYAERYIIDQLSIIDGVARVRIGGARRYAMRIWLDRKAMVGKKITVQDIIKALNENNIELPGGRIESSQREFTLWIKRQFTTPGDFKKLVIKKEKNGHLLRLGEVAKVVLGAENRRTELRGNGREMIGLGIIKQSKANTLDVTKNIKKALKKISLPKGTEILVSYDTSLFIHAAIFEVYKTFAIALVLVLFVIFIFLGRAKNIIIPFVTIPVALISTFAILYYLDFSLNLLTLLGLVLAIGLVVDDAIVVLENINRRMSLGEPSLLASYQGTRQVGFAVIATTMVLLSVFLPISLLQGNVGRLFTEFAITIATAVVFSSIVALTLTPVMCASLLKKTSTKTPADRFMVFINRWYKKTLKIALRHSYIILTGFLLVVFSAFFLFKLIPQQLVPKEDRGAFFVFVKGPEGASFSYMKSYMRKIEKIMMKPVNKGVATRALTIIPLGFGSSDVVNSGLGIVVMKNWEERDVNTKDLMLSLSREFFALPGVLAFPVMRSSISNSTSQPVQFVIGNTSYENLVKWRDIIMEKARRNTKILNLDSDFKPTKVQLEIQINHERAAELGVTTQAIGQSFEALFGSRDVTTFINKDEEYDVILESDLSQKSSLSDLKNIYVRSATTNRMVPIANVATIKERTIPNALYRYNRIKAITISANLAPGYSLGDALAFLEGIVKKHLPETVTIDYKDQSREFKQAQASVYFTFFLSLVIMYLVMAAQFGSFIHPIVLLITVPLAISGALLGLYITKDTLNIYSQIGLIMLIGLAAKNGILMIEFINQLREQGFGFYKAILEGCVIRLRPILMTAISTIFGSIPLVFATGAGSESRISIGIVIFFGISFATILTLFAVPVAYAKIAKNTKPRNYYEREVERLEKEY